MTRLDQTAQIIELGTRAQHALTEPTPDHTDLYVIECADKDVRSSELTLVETAITLAALANSPYPCKLDHVIRPVTV